MSIAPGFCGVILAAGESSRMGRDKALLAWRGRTFLEGAIESLRPHTDMVLVVAGKNHEALAPIIFAAGAFLVENPAPERGQFSSLQVGLREVLNRGRDAAIVVLVDRPPAQAGTVGLLREAFVKQSTEGKWAVVPEHDGRHGHPIVVGRELIEAFLRAPASANARDIEHQWQERVAYVPVDDAVVVQNIDTLEDYQKLTGA
ncbi:MAG: nucleotidyltransferase family protein [Terriglobales bacterium]